MKHGIQKNDTTKKCLEMSIIKYLNDQSLLIEDENIDIKIFDRGEKNKIFESTDVE